MKYFMRYSVSVWLGIMPVIFLGLGIDTWEWWIVVIPTQILITLSRYEASCK